MISSVKKQLAEVFYKKVVLKKIAKFTGKHLCQSPVVASLCSNIPQFFSQHIILSTILRLVMRAAGNRN